MKLKTLTFLIDGYCSMVLFSIDCLFLVFLQLLVNIFPFPKNFSIVFPLFFHSFILQPFTIGFDAPSNASIVMMLSRAPSELPLLGRFSFPNITRKYSFFILFKELANDSIVDVTFFITFLMLYYIDVNFQEHSVQSISSSCFSDILNKFICFINCALDNYIFYSFSPPR